MTKQIIRDIIRDLGLVGLIADRVKAHFPAGAYLVNSQGEFLCISSAGRFEHAIISVDEVGNVRVGTDPTNIPPESFQPDHVGPLTPTKEARIREIVREEMRAATAARLDRFFRNERGLSEPFRALVEASAEQLSKGSPHGQ